MHRTPSVAAGELVLSSAPVVVLRAPVFWVQMNAAPMSLSSPLSRYLYVSL
eukprot:COSAG01_NODE_3186_length_6441_cov_145.702460_5_plen_51_part_00